MLVRRTAHSFPRFLPTTPGKFPIFSLKQIGGAFYRTAYDKTENAEDFPQFGQFLIDRSKHPLIPRQVTSPVEAASLYNDDYKYTVYNGTVIHHKKPNFVKI